VGPQFLQNTSKQMPAWFGSPGPGEGFPPRIASGQGRGNAIQGECVVAHHPHLGGQGVISGQFTRGHWHQLNVKAVVVVENEKPFMTRARGRSGARPPFKDQATKPAAAAAASNRAINSEGHGGHSTAAAAQSLRSGQGMEAAAMGQIHTRTRSPVLISSSNQSTAVTVSTK